MLEILNKSLSLLEHDALFTGGGLKSENLPNAPMPHRPNAPSPIARSAATRSNLGISERKVFTNTRV
jgi:hypothetical protein